MSVFHAQFVAKVAGMERRPPDGAASGPKIGSARSQLRSASECAVWLLTVFGTGACLASRRPFEQPKGDSQRVAERLRLAGRLQRAERESQKDGDRQTDSERLREREKERQ